MIYPINDGLSPFRPGDILQGIDKGDLKRVKVVRKGWLTITGVVIDGLVFIIGQEEEEVTNAYLADKYSLLYGSRVDLNYSPN